MLDALNTGPNSSIKTSEISENSCPGSYYLIAITFQKSEKPIKAAFRIEHALDQSTFT